MAREIDLRDFSTRQFSPHRERELRVAEAEDSRALPGEHRVRIQGFNPLTGTPSAVHSEAAPVAEGDYARRAVEHLQGIRRTLGFAAGPVAEFDPDPHVQMTSSGAAAVHLQQLYRGIPIFQANEMVRFAPDGAIRDTVGSPVTVASDWNPLPEISASQAVEIAAGYVARPDPDEADQVDPFGEPLSSVEMDLSGFQPELVAEREERPEHPCVFAAGPFAERIHVSLLWFAMGGGMRLSWEVLMSLPGFSEQYRTLVDASDGRILYCHQLLHSIAAQGSVYTLDGRNPRQPVDFPLPLDRYGLPLPNDLPGTFAPDWVESEDTRGNSTDAHLGVSGRTLRGDRRQGRVVFEPQDPDGDDQKILNIFYFNCYMHDFFYLLGFREADGNFQRDNFGQGGSSGDRVDARAHSGAVRGTANMATPVDGRNPVMNMGLVRSTGRHTAFDSSVVFHEYTHGVTNRLVGGRRDARALDAPQSGGMGEGWSDYIACSINDTVVVGDWVVDRPGGIRGFAYDANFPDQFGQLGSGRYDEVHNIGEVWCAALLQMNRNIGRDLGLILMVDGLKLTPANPSFLDARDGIRAALENLHQAGGMDDRAYQHALRGLWAAFAQFGMGPGAQSNGASLRGVVADFSVPDDVPVDGGGLGSRPNLAIPDNDAAGISDVIGVDRDGRLTRVVVQVDIQHTFVGDLVVSLESPTGTRVILHDRAGGGADDLVRSYTPEQLPDLAGLVGEEARGDWTLRVSDRAGRDRGVLRAWSLDLESEAAPVEPVAVETAPGLAIPDNDANGIRSEIPISASGTAVGIEVEVVIRHTWIGDLRVVLESPSGTEVVLHDRSGRDQQDLDRRYDSSQDPGLADLLGEALSGIWVLRVMDLAGRDRGTLDRWGMVIQRG